MSLSLTQRSWFTVFAVTYAMCLHPAFAPDATGKNAQREKPDPLAIPEGEPADLIEFIEKVNGRGFILSLIQDGWRSDTSQGFRAVREVTIEAADRVIAAEAATGDEAVVAIRAKLKALNHARISDKKVDKKIDAFLASLRKDKRPEVVDVHKFCAFRHRLSKLHGADPAKIKAAATDLKQMLSEADSQPEHAALVQRIVMLAKRSGGNETASHVARELGEVLAKSDNEEIRKGGQNLIGTSRRFVLLGNEVKIMGKMLNGSDFDFAPYKGKVVLVNFWATWCGSCMRELPNLRNNYELYHNRGFEVIGISLDTDREKVERFLKDHEIPWRTLYSDDPENNGWNHPTASYYGITGIPTVILVNPQGKVVSLQARGPRLKRLLAELLGPPPKQP